MDTFQLIKWSIISYYSPTSFARKCQNCNYYAPYGIGEIDLSWYNECRGYNLDLVRTELSKRKWWKDPMIDVYSFDTINRQNIMQHFYDANFALLVISRVEQRIQSLEKGSFQEPYNALEILFAQEHRFAGTSKNFSRLSNCFFGEHDLYESIPRWVRATSMRGLLALHYKFIDGYYANRHREQSSTNMRVSGRYLPPSAIVEVIPNDKLNDTTYYLKKCFECKRFKENTTENWCQDPQYQRYPNRPICRSCCQVGFLCAEKCVVGPI